MAQLEFPLPQKESTPEGFMRHQCPTCGRMGEDWSDNLNGYKFETKRVNDDRTYEYRKWHLSLGSYAYMTDVDCVEWRFAPEDPVTPIPVAVIELSRIDGVVPIPGTYLQAILDRYERRDAQARTARKVAAALGVKAWIVAFRWDLSEFHVWNLTDMRGWWRMDQAKYATWIRELA